MIFVSIMLLFLLVVVVTVPSDHLSIRSESFITNGIGLFFLHFVGFLFFFFLLLFFLLKNAILFLLPWRLAEEIEIWVHVLVSFSFEKLRSFFFLLLVFKCWGRFQNISFSFLKLFSLIFILCQAILLVTIHVFFHYRLFLLCFIQRLYFLIVRFKLLIFRFI